MSYNKEKDYEKFIKVWLKAKKLKLRYSYVADKLEITEDEVAGTAMYLRNRGVNLPSLSKTVELDTDRLNKLIDGALNNMGVK